jgi:riboflavin-specific deaminase-like protein
MQSSTGPASPDAERDPVTQTAWRALLAAAAWANEHGDAATEQVAFGFAPDGGLASVPPKSRHAWLRWSAAAGWSSTPFTPPAARPLLDLYLPICGVTPHRPLAVAHLGQSLDGFIATDSGDSYYVTGPANVLHLHRLRALCDAVVVGAGTVERDDPQLTVRHAQGRHPVRVILDPHRRLAPDRRVFRDTDAMTLLVCAEDAPAPPEPLPVEILALPAPNGRLPLAVLLERLRARGWRSVLVEGGGATVSSFFEAGLLDRLQIAVAPLITGRGRRGIDLPARASIADAVRPAHRVFLMGADVLFDCDLRATAVDHAPAVNRVL